LVGHVLERDELARPPEAPTLVAHRSVERLEAPGDEVGQVVRVAAVRLEGGDRARAVAGVVRRVRPPLQLGEIGRGGYAELVDASGDGGDVVRVGVAGVLRQHRLRQHRCGERAEDEGDEVARAHGRSYRVERYWTPTR